MKRKIKQHELEFILKVKSLSCVICKAPPPSEFHHICDTGRRLGHMYGLPLCVNCHRGDDGFSGKNRSAWDKSRANQKKLCKKVYKKLGLEYIEPVSKVLKRLD